jgi:hypothetical protein
MRERIKSCADKNGRSMNSEIITRLEESLSASEHYEREMDFYSSHSEEAQDNSSILSRIIPPEGIDFVDILTKEMERANREAIERFREKMIKSGGSFIAFTHKDKE